MLFKTSYNAPRKFVLVHVQLEQQEQQLRYVVAGRGAASLPETIEWTAVANVDELLKKAGKNLPYVLHLTGFGVLSRIAEYAPNYKESLLVTGNEDDFYFSCYELKSTVGVSFIRRSLLENIIVQLAANKVFLWGIHTGPVPLLALLDEKVLPPDGVRNSSESSDLNPPPKGEVKLDYIIEIHNGDLKKLERTTGEIKRLATDSGFMDVDKAYVSALQQLTNQPPEAYHQGLSAAVLKQTKADYKEFVRFVKLGTGILAFFLLALSGNYFYVNHLNGMAAQLEADISGYGENLAMIDRLQQEKQRKLLLIEHSGVQSPKYISYYLDDLGASVPASIQLTSLETFPLTEPLKPKRKVELNTRQMTISGWSGSSKVLDDWMENIERKKWVAGVELINYVRLSDSRATFNLLVKIGE
jgi:Tfp pilus assembly protein PilN